MKILVLALCMVLASAHAIPIDTPQQSVADLLDYLDWFVKNEGHKLLTKIVNVVKHVEDGILRLKELVPKVYHKFHDDADDVLHDLKEIIEELKEFFAKKKEDVHYGFDILDEITSLTGGTKLSTVIRVLKVAESAQKVIQDAKELSPKLNVEIDKIGDIITKHVDQLTKHVLSEMGLDDDQNKKDDTVVQKSIVKDIEDLVENFDEKIHILIVNVVKHVEDGILLLKEIVPKVNQKFHNDADQVLDELKEIVKELKEFFTKKLGDVYYGFGILDEITSLTGGTKLSTVIRVLKLAESAQKVVQDAKELSPKLDKEIDKIGDIISKHVDSLTTHVLSELGLDDEQDKKDNTAIAQKSIVKDIEDLVGKIQDKIHALALTLLKEMENSFDVMEEELPEVYAALQDKIEEVRKDSREILHDLKESLLQHGVVPYGILDIAGDFTKGTRLGTVVRILLVIEKFNNIIQDVRGFGPHAEILLKHSFQKVTSSAEDFLGHATELIFS